MKKSVISFILILSLVCTCTYAEKFEFKYHEGDSYRILSTVHEDVLVNGKLNHKAEIINRISVKVTGIDKEGRGINEAHFMTSERSLTTDSNSLYTWGEEYESAFTRDKFGVYTISDEYFMPVVRDVPIFPDKDLKVGEKWSYEGHEAHDLRNSFGIEKPFKVPFTANYTYYGETKKDGKKYHIIKASYTLYYDSPSTSKTDFYPISTMGFSDQTILWDNERGMIQSYNEKFRIQMETNTGDVLLFKGTASAEVQDIVIVKDEKTLEKVKEHISDLGIKNTDVKATEKGLTINIENINFKADSDILEESEKAKLQQITEILKAFPYNDILVEGHTALVGTEESCRELSEKRANAVAAYLIEAGAKDRQHIFTKGLGASKPIASNSTTEGMSKNRRVEITIMEQ